MKPRTHPDLPDEQRQILAQARRLEWWTIFFLGTIVVVMFLAMGQSQAMKTAWIEDILSLIPPCVFLISERWQKRAPDERFPYGYRRASGIAFIVASASLAIFGGLLFYHSAMSLIRAEHPTIGSIDLFGKSVWMGWVMGAALIYGVIPPVILGIKKSRLAMKIHDNTLLVDAHMNRADWMTGVAAAAGVIGIGFGWWWADAAASIVISLDILRDGVLRSQQAITDLMDERPNRVGSSDPDPIIPLVGHALESLPWVRAAEVRLRDEGRFVGGEAFVEPYSCEDLPRRLGEANEMIHALSWRLTDVVVTAVEDPKAPRPS